MKKSGRKWARAWRLYVDTKDAEEMIGDPAAAGLSVYVRLKQISAEGRRTLDGLRVPWFDVEKKERSRSTNDSRKKWPSSSDVMGSGSSGRPISSRCACRVTGLRSGGLRWGSWKRASRDDCREGTPG